MHTNTTAAARPAPAWGPHVKKWIIIDRRFQLLSVGDTLYGGTSPRTTLDITSRRVLLPRMRQAIIDGRARTDAVAENGRRVAVRVVPVLGPISRSALAVLGCYGPDSAGFPPEPLVGAWEWRVTPPGPDQEMRTYWSESLYDVYALPRPATGGTNRPQRNYWEGPEWLDRLIVASDRVEMRRVLDELIAATTDALFIHSYRVRSPSTGEVHRLRLAGRSDVADGRPVKWLRGVSMPIDHLDTDADLERSSQTYLDAAFTLAGDPLCAVDTWYEHIYMTSNNFSDLGIALPSHRYLPRMVHPDDVAPLRRWLTDAAASTTTPVGPVRIRFASLGGGWTTLSLTGTGVRLSKEEPHHVLCRVTETRDQLA